MPLPALYVPPFPFQYIWSSVGRSWFYLTDLKCLLAHECGRLVSYIQRSKTRHEKTGRELFFVAAVGQRHVSVVVRVTLVREPRRKAQKDKLIQGEVQEGHSKAFLQVYTGPGRCFYWQQEAEALHIGGSSFFCAVQSSNNRRCLPGHKESTETRNSTPRKTNVKFRVADPKYAAEYRKQHTLQVFTPREIKADEQLLANYVKEDWFEYFSIKNLYKEKTEEPESWDAEVNRALSEYWKHENNLPLVKYVEVVRKVSGSSNSGELIGWLGLLAIELLCSRASRKGYNRSSVCWSNEESWDWP